jgi:hypothetical protein
MSDYISFLLPVYQTFMCDGCGGIFYDLLDAAKLEEIKVNVVMNTAKALDNAIGKAMKQLK